MSFKSQYLAWKKSPSVGCNFARYAALKPDDHGQVVAIVKGDDVPKIAKRIDSGIEKAVAEPRIHAATFLLPEVRELRAIVDVALLLATKPGWNVQRSLITNTDAGDLVAFEVSREVPTSDGRRVPSQALILGDFDVFPVTRRAPVTALEIFVGTCPEKNHKGDVCEKGNLDLLVHSMPLENPQIAKMWDGTTELRLKVLGGHDDLRAKAKVAFVVPITLATAIGCVP